jgi:hypothetical protein
MGLLAAQHLPATVLGDTNIIDPYCDQPISENSVQDRETCFRNISNLKKISICFKVLFLSEKKTV